MKSNDSINHPAHYNKGPIEVIDFIEAWNMGFHEGNIIKYITRHPYKGTQLEDLKKAQFYINRLIENVKKAP